MEGFALDADWRIDGLDLASPDIARYSGPGSGESLSRHPSQEFNKNIN